MVDGSDEKGTLSSASMHDSMFPNSFLNNRNAYKVGSLFRIDEIDHRDHQRDEIRAGRPLICSDRSQWVLCNYLDRE